MTQREFERTLQRAVEDAHLLVQQVAPVRTGQLQRSIKLVATAEGYSIIVDTGEAPHMPYTEEKWLHERWKGRANPNEGWFREVTELVFRLLRARLRASGTFIGNRE